MGHAPGGVRLVVDMATELEVEQVIIPGAALLALMQQPARGTWAWCGPSSRQSGTWACLQWCEMVASLQRTSAPACWPSLPACSRTARWMHGLVAGSAAGMKFADVLCRHSVAAACWQLQGAAAEP